ncbi:early nodulin-75-like [Vigna unguiculata]|uniref:early nodulin-75-like n=1 Tax=Vigna unguiculata TaxID=3917 RepID=UPI001016CA87|nr:early nodulin-75-like [Vigna unguiculata]
MSPKNMLVLLLPFLVVASSLAILPTSSPSKNDGTHNPKPPHRNKPPPHIENGHLKPPHHGKPPPHMEDALYHDKPPNHFGDKPQHIEDGSYDGKPPHHGGKPPSLKTTKDLPPKEQQGTGNQHPRPGHGGHKVESTNFRPIDPPGSD